MIRVLHILGSLDIGGIESVVINYYRNIDHSKVQFDFLLASTHKGHYDDEVLSLGANIYYRTPRRKSPIQNSIGLVRVLSLHPEIKIIHIHTKHTIACLDTTIAALMGIPVRIVHGHSALPKSKFIQKFFQPMLRATATHWFCCSTEAGVFLFGKAAKKTGKLILCPNARNLEQFRFSQAKRDELRQEMKLDGKFVLIHAARLSREKNQEFLFEAFAYALKQSPDLTLLIVGDGALRPALEAKAAALKLGDSVQFLGFRNDVPGLLQAADVFLLPSLYEGFGVVAIEAQAAGMPVLVSDTVTTECKVTDLVFFLTIEKGPEIWGEQILKYHDFIRQDTLEDVQRAGYDIRDAAQKMVDFYSDALNKS